jgi:hypothetical protein
MRGVRRSLREEWRQFQEKCSTSIEESEVVWKVKPLQVSLANQEVECYLIAQEVESTEYKQGLSSTYTARRRTRGVVLHMLRGWIARTKGVTIHKATVRKKGRRRGMKGAHQQVLMCA